MGIFYLVAGLPLALAVAAAAAGWVLAGRRHLVATGAVRVLIIAAMGVALLVMFAYWLLTVNPWMVPVQPPELGAAMNDLRFALPLVAGTVALLVLAFPLRPVGSRGVGAELSRRTLLSFSQRWWFVAFGVLLLLTLAVTVAAGLASRPDDEGRYTFYSFEVGSGSVGTTIYGWYYSVPCLILLAIIVGIMTVNLSIISKPALGTNRDTDTAIRRLRSLNVARAGSGTVLLHLSAVLLLLAGTSTLSAGFGSVTVGSSFAAFTPFLYFTGGVAGVAGLALWISTLLSTVPALAVARTRVEAP